MSLPRFTDPELIARKHAFMQLFSNVLTPYGFADAERVHLSRTIRSALHGYCALTAAGFFQLPLAASGESFDRMVDWLCEIVEKEAARHD